MVELKRIASIMHSLSYSIQVDHQCWCSCWIRLCIAISEIEILYEYTKDVHDV